MKKTDAEYDMNVSDEEMTEMAMAMSESSLAEDWDNDEDYEGYQKEFPEEKDPDEEERVENDKAEIRMKARMPEVVNGKKFPKHMLWCRTQNK